jgi:predicted transposase/invertase (TIGR01784 family)
MIKEKTLQELNLDDDFLFSKVMQDKEICKEFLEKLLNIEIERIENPQSEKNFNPNLDAKGIRLDVYVKDEKNTVYNIEMQSANKDNIPKRLRYYQSGMDIDSIEKGKRYKDLAKTYIIFICTFDLFKKGRHRYTFETRCVEDNSIKLDDESYKIILNTTGIIDDMNKEMLDFLKYVEHSDDETANNLNSTLVKNIHNKVKKVKNNHEIEVEYMTLLDRDREKREEGRLEGEKNKSIEIAKKAILKGYDDEEIQELTELSIERIEEIRKSLI